MKALKKIFIALFGLSLTFSFLACSGDDAEVENFGTSVTITFDGNGGKTSDGSTTKTVTTSSVYYFSSASTFFTYSGYTLLGWSTTQKTPSPSLSVSDCNYKSADSKTFTADTTLYAVWKPSSNAQITLKFYANGGKYNGSSSLAGLYPDATATVTEGEAYSFTTTSAKFTYTGYTLLGWSTTKKTPSSSLTSSDCDVTADGSTTFSSANSSTISLYAVWKQDSTATKITVKLYGNGGKYNGSSTTDLLAAASVEVEKGESYSLATESAKFTYTGYTLLGWSTTKKTPSSSLTSSDCNVTANGSTTFSSTNGTTISLYAVWKINSTSDTSNGVIASGSIEIKAGEYEYTYFTLSKTATLTVSMSCSDTMYYYLVDSTNFTLFKNGSTFQYYSAVSTPSGAKTASGTVSLSAGTYYYILQNKNILSAKEVTRKITYTAN